MYSTDCFSISQTYNVAALRRNDGLVGQPKFFSPAPFTSPKNRPSS
jgi:hypothetical protein